MFVDGNLRHLWKSNPEKYEKLTPIRHWELNEKYQVSTSIKLSKVEGKRILMTAIPSIIFFVVTSLSLIADFALASLLDAILENGEFGISFSGMEQRIDLGELFGAVEEGEINMASLNLAGFDLSSDVCLPRFVEHHVYETS